MAKLSVNRVSLGSEFQTVGVGSETLNARLPIRYCASESDECRTIGHLR